MSDNWIVQNLENALKTWNDKLSEIWQLITPVSYTHLAVRHRQPYQSACGESQRPELCGRSDAQRGSETVARVSNRCPKKISASTESTIMAVSYTHLKNHE